MNTSEVKRMERNWKRFGDAKTHLVLSPDAMRQYSRMSPISIFESKTDDGEYRYHIRGIDRYDDFTDAEVNSYLEEICREVDEIEAEDE